MLKDDKLSILNPSFKYIPAAQTDIRKTFKRIREQLFNDNPPKNQENNKPLVLNPEGFVLPAEWFEILG
jgi:hypothetical protein